MYYHKLILFLLGLLIFCSIENTQSYELYNFDYNLQPDQPQISSAEFLRAMQEYDPTDLVNERVQTSMSTSPGGKTLQNPNDPTYIELANESMQKYLTNNGISQPYRVIHINKVTTQVVAGTLTRIEFVVAPIENIDGNIYNCFSKILEQPWLSKKDIDVCCDNVYKRTKRDAFPGGETLQNPNDPKYIELAHESMQKYFRNNGIFQPYKVTYINKVTTQVVAGTLTKISFAVAPHDSGDKYNCFSKILEQPWLSKKEINVNCDNQKSNEGGFLVGEQPQNPNDPKYIELANESIQKYLKNNGIFQPHRLIYITKVSTQTVAGILIRINFVMAPNRNTESVPFLYCFSKIWEQQWLNKKDINVICDKATPVY